MAETEEQGASNNQRLLAAAREDNEDLLLEVFDEEGTFDINFQDGLGNTALHVAAQHGSLATLEHILGHELCDVDLQNRIEKATPLHLAVQISDEETRKLAVESLLDAGANTKVKDKSGSTVMDLVPPDSDLWTMIRKAQAEAAISRDDIASDDDDDDDEDSEGSEEEE